MKKLAVLWLILWSLGFIAFGQNPQTQTAPIYSVNAKYANGMAPGYWPTQLAVGSQPAATGLNINVGPGTANCGSGTMVTYAGGTFALTASATNLIYLDTTSSCAPAVKTSAFVSTDIPVAVVVTGSSTITSITDDRTPFSVPPGTSGINQLTGDVNAGPGSGSQASLLKAINGVSLCTGTPVNGQPLTYRTDASPNPCWGPKTISGGTGIQYGTIVNHVILNDSLQLVANHDSTQDDSVTGFSCTGSPTNTCSFTAGNISKPWYVVGNRIQFPGNVTGYASWSPSCMNFAEKIITGISGSVVTIDELAWNIPNQGGQGGCSGVVSGTGGTVYNAENIAPSQAMKLPYFNNGGTITPVLYNRAWPGFPLSSMSSGIASYIGDLNPDTTGTPAILWLMSDDVCGTNTLGGWQSQLGTILTYLHSHGWVVHLMTIPNAHTPAACGLGPVSVDSFIVNQWINTQQCTTANTLGPSPCADRVIDTWSEGLNNWTDANIAQQSGNFVRHLTTEGAGVLAAIMAKSLVTKARPRGQANAGLGPNSFQDVQSFMGGLQGGTLYYLFNLRGGTLFQNVNGDDGINNVGYWRAGYGYYQFDTSAFNCWAQNGGVGGPPQVCLGASPVLSSGYSQTIDVNVGTFPSTTTQPTHNRGGSLAYQFWYMHGIASDPSCSSGLLTNDSMGWYNYTSGQWGFCSGGTAVHPGNNVTSVFGRTGAVAATSGDYSVGQITGAAPITSPTFTGIPAAPTASGGTNTTQLATTAFVQAAIAAAGTGSGIVTYSGPSLTFTGTLYFPIGGGGLSSTTETNVDVDSPAAVTIQNMTVQLSAALTTGNSITFTWRKNASSTVLTCTVNGSASAPANQSCSDTTHSFTTAALDLLDIQATTSGTVLGTPTVVMAAQVGVSSTTSTAFSAISGGTNTGNALVVGNSSSINPSGTGVNNANQVNGATVAANLTSLATDSSGHIVAGSGGGGGDTNIISSITPTGCSVSGKYCVVSGTTTTSFTIANIPTTGTTLIFQINASVISGTQPLRIRFNNDSTAGHYGWLYYGYKTAGSLVQTQNTSDAQANLWDVLPTGNSTTITCTVGIYSGSPVSSLVPFSCEGAGVGTTGAEVLHAGGYYNASAPITSVYVEAAGLNFSSGTSITAWLKN